jgi:hypothetical protein
MVSSNDRKNSRCIVSVITIWLLVCVGFVGLNIITDEVSAAGPTYVSWIISTDSTWKAANSPYIVTGNVLVDENITLTIEPDVTVKFDADKYLRIDGTLKAVGTELQMIIFTSNNTSPAPSDWGGLRFENTCNGSILKYCKIEYGGPGINNAANNLVISYNNIENNSASSGDHEGGGFYNSGSAIISYSTIKGNSAWYGGGIYNRGSAIINYSTISSNYAQTHGSGIYNVYGNMNIDHCEIYANYGTHPSTEGGGIYNDLDSTVNISRSTIKENSATNGGGIYVWGSTTLFSYCTITGNTATSEGSGIYITGQITINIKNSNLNNSNYNIYLTSSSHVNATYNYWGTTDTDLINQSINDYYDSYELGKVIYEPFLTSPVNISKVTVPNQPPIANAGPDQNVYANQTVNFDGSGSYDLDGDSLTYKWDFGDGKSTSWQNSSNASHSYNKIGNYTITLTVFDGSLWDTDTCVVRVSSAGGGGSTNVGGIISKNTTWYQKNSPYIVKDDILIEEGINLTIEPGVEVRFDGDYYLQVNGILYAVGNPDNRILFTSNKPSPSSGDWKEIKFNSNDDSSLKYCTIEYGGSYDETESGGYSHQVIYIKKSSPEISNNIILNNDAGIVFGNRYQRTFSNNIIFYNKGFGICIAFSSSYTFSITRNVIVGNYNGIYLYWHETDLSINYNDIYQNNNKNILIRSGSGGNENINATNNFWGTTNTTIIDEYIHDFFDDYNLGKVIYKPFSTSQINNYNQPPIAKAGKNKSAFVNEQIIFNGSDSYDPDGDMLRYIWYFGDGTNSGWLNTNTASHSYEKPGKYLVTLSVTDRLLSSTDTFIITIISDDDGNDTDGDNVPDSLDPNPNQNIDTDTDGLSDDYEDVISKTDKNNLDTDGDGYNDKLDAFPLDPTKWLGIDSDSDNYPDSIDAFPYNNTQWNDTDRDGHGDNLWGNNGDAFIHDPDEWTDSDGDGIGDNSDKFPKDIAASIDVDDDGYPDSWNPGKSAKDSTTGLKLDAYPNDPNRYKKETSQDNTYAISLVVIVIIVLLLIATSKLFLSRSKCQREKRPYSEDEILNKVKDKFLSGESLKELEYSRNEIEDILERTFKTGQISENTYNLIRSEILYSDETEFAQPNNSIPKGKE